MAWALLGVLGKIFGGMELSELEAVVQAALREAGGGRLKAFTVSVSADSAGTRRELKTILDELGYLDVELEVELAAGPIRLVAVEIHPED
jgi:hypothetical protein